MVGMRGFGHGTVRVLLAAGGLVALLTACGEETHEVPDDPLGRLLISGETISDDYEPVVGPVSGPQTFEDAAAATMAEYRTMAEGLQEHGFVGAYSRAWARDQDHIFAIVYEMQSADAADEIVDLQLRELAIRRGILYEDARVPRGFAFIVGGQRRTEQGGPLFCQGYWFSRGEFVFMVQTCAPRPGSTQFAQDLALEQLERFPDDETPDDETPDNETPDNETPDDGDETDAE